MPGIPVYVNSDRPRPEIEIVAKPVCRYNIPPDFRLEGWVYALTNPSMPGLMKIGMTTGTPEQRAKEISQGTGVPTPFQVARAYYSHNPREDEQAMHEYLAPIRLSQSREFFSASMSDLELAAAECGLSSREDPLEQIAEGYDIICFNRMQKLNLDDLFEELGVNILGCKLSTAESLIRMAHRLVKSQSDEGNSVIFHGNKARLLKSISQQSYETYLKDCAKKEAESGIYGPRQPGGF
jgi:hypothetical protein